MTKYDPDDDYLTLKSFRYYDHYCVLARQGIPKDCDPIEQAKQFRTDINKCQHTVHYGVFWIYLDGRPNLITPSEKEANERYEALKDKIMIAHA